MIPPNDTEISLTESLPVVSSSVGTGPSYRSSTTMPIVIHDTPRVLNTFGWGRAPVCRARGRGRADAGAEPGARGGGSGRIQRVAATQSTESESRYSGSTPATASISQ
jgi:hypothetical protein